MPRTPAAPAEAGPFRPLQRLQPGPHRGATVASSGLGLWLPFLNATGRRAKRRRRRASLCVRAWLDTGCACVCSGRSGPGADRACLFGFGANERCMVRRLRSQSWMHAFALRGRIKSLRGPNENTHVSHRPLRPQRSKAPTSLALHPPGSRSRNPCRPEPRGFWLDRLPWHPPRRRLSPS